jgi:hypothetical protein
MQAIPLLVRASVAIIVLPLNAIGEEQLLKIRAIPGANPVFVCAEVIKAHADILKHIKAGRFTHVLVSPELLSSKRFHHILTWPTFRSHVSLVVIDECHLVANWGKSFRPHYAQLFKVRSLLGPTVPWFACTATLDEETYAKVMKLAGFHWSTTDLERTDIDRPDLSIIRGYIKRRDKNNYKALFFVIKEAFKEAVVEEDYTSATLGQISAGSGEISASSSQTPAAPSRISATSIHQSVGRIQNPAGGTAQPKRRKVPSPELIPKTIIFLHAKNHIRGCMNTIRSWLITKGYTIKQAKMAVRSYHATLSECDKSREYRNFYTEGSPTRILITSDALAHGADIPDIIRSIVYGYHPDKSLNMILQRFGRAARRDGVTGYAIILIEDWYKGALADIAPPKRKSRKPTAPLSTRLGRDFIAARMAIQEDGAADFASDLASFVTIDSNVISQVSAREEEDRILNENITSLALPIEHMEKQKRAKTDAEKRAVLPDILYELANEATGCLRNILLKPYKETSPLSGGPRCCSNCDNSLQAYKEYDIVAPYTRNIAKSKYSKDLFASVKKWIKGWLDTTYQDAVWSPISSHIISDDQIRMLCIQPPLTREGLKRILPEWDYSFLGDEVDALIRFIREEETRYSSTSVSQAASQSSRRVAVSGSSSQTPPPLVGQRGPVGALTNQPLQTEVLPPLQLSLASSSQTDITESQISQLTSTQDLQANWSQTTHAALSQSSQQLHVQPLEQSGYQSPQRSIESKSLGQSEYQSSQYNTESQLSDKPEVQYSQHSTRSPITKNPKVQDPQRSTSSQVVGNPEIQNSQRSIRSPLLENPEAQDLSYDTESPLLGNSEAQGLQADAQSPPSELGAVQNSRTNARSPPSKLGAAQSLQPNVRSPLSELRAAQNLQPGTRSPPSVLDVTQLSGPPRSKRKRKDVSAHFESEKSAYQVNPISAYNPSPAPQPSSDSISMSLRKSTRPRPLSLISSNLTVKDLRVTNKRVRGG